MLLLPAQMTTMTFFSGSQTTSLPVLAANVEALSKHLKLGGGQGEGASHHGILEPETPTPSIACFDV